SWSSRAYCQRSVQGFRHRTRNGEGSLGRGQEARSENSGRRVSLHKQGHDPCLRESWFQESGTYSWEGLQEWKICRLSNHGARTLTTPELTPDARAISPTVATKESKPRRKRNGWTLRLWPIPNITERNKNLTDK